MLTIKRPHVPDSHKFREYASRWKSPLWSKALYKLVGPVYRDRTTNKGVNDYHFTTLEGWIVSSNGRKHVNYCSHVKFTGEFIISVMPVKSGFRGFYTNEEGIRCYEGSKDWRTQTVSESSDSFIEEEAITYNNNQNKMWTKYSSTRGQCLRETVNVFNQVHHAPDLSYSWWSTEGSGKTVIEDIFDHVEYVGNVDKMRVYYTRTTRHFAAANERRTSSNGFPRYANCKTTIEHRYEDIGVWQTLDLSNGDECFWPIWAVKLAIHNFGNSLLLSLPTYTEQLAVEAYDETCKQLSSNNIENAVQLRSTISSVWELPLSLLKKAKTFATLVRDVKRLNLKSILRHGKTAAQIASELHLWYRYVFKPTKKDFQELLRYSKKAIKRQRCFNGQWTRAQSSGNKVIYPDGITAVTAKRNFSCYLRSSYPGGTPLARMRAYGVDLSLANAWDLIPFSFVLDWFIEVGPWLQTIESMYAYALFNFKNRCYSAKAEIDLGAVASLSQYGQGGSVKAYLRDPLWSVQFPSLPEIAHGKSYKLTAMALIVSNM